MQELLILLVNDLPEELATFLISMIPVTELRASVPIAISLYEMSPISAWFWSVLGNTLMGASVVITVEPASKYIIKRISFLDRLWGKYIGRIKEKNENKFEKWGAIALITFVAIPLPMTGAFTGAVAASIFQIPFKKAVPLLLIGCMISGALVAGITLAFGVGAIN